MFELKYTGPDDLTDDFEWQVVNVGTGITFGMFDPSANDFSPLCMTRETAEVLRDELNSIVERTGKVLRNMGMS